jgi:tetratricopeptide (TPR) repeat protein
MSIGQSCHYVLQLWRKEHTTLLQLQGAGLGRLTSVDVSISLSLDSLLVSQNPEAVELLSVISYLPDGLLNWEKNLASVAKNFKRAHHAVAVLLKAALVYADNAGALKVLSPIRHHMIDRHPPLELHIQQLEAHYTCMIEKYATISFGAEFSGAMKILLPENGNIKAVIQSALANHASKTLIHSALTMSRFLQRSQPSTDIIELLLQNSLAQHDLQIYTECLQCCGTILYNQNKYSEAQMKLEEAQRQFTQIGDQLGAAQCLQSVGDILRMQGNYAEAQVMLEEAQRQFIQIGDQLGAAQCLGILGKIPSAKPQSGL